MIGDSGLMRRQVRHLEDAVTRPQRHRPGGADRSGRAPRSGRPFVLLELDGDPTLVYLENRGGSAILEEDGDIERVTTALQHLQQIALSSDDSLA